MPAEPTVKREIAFFDGQNRWVKIACAFPTSPTCDNTRGINKTDWIRISRDTYDACLDPCGHRPKGTNPSLT